MTTEVLHAITQTAGGLANAVLLRTSDDPERQARNEARQRLAWGSVVDYVTMLQFIIEDWRRWSATYFERIQRHLEAVKAEPPGAGRPVMQAELEDLRRDRVIALRQRLAEESLYVFGNILLDRAAIAAKHTLFAHGFEGRPSSHSELAARPNGLEELAAAAGLPLPGESLMELARRLESEFSEFRDKFIVHPLTGDVRVAMGHGFGLDTGEVSLFPGIINPTSVESSAEPQGRQPTTRLLDELFEYLEALTAWVEQAHATALAGSEKS